MTKAHRTPALATVVEDRLRMNRLEAAYADYLGLLVAAGELCRADFEPERLRLGGDFKTTYLPDFRVILLSGVVEFHEVKATWRKATAGRRHGWQDAGRVKIKVAADLHPYVFRGVTRVDGGWQWETFTPGAGAWLEPTTGAKARR